MMRLMIPVMAMMMVLFGVGVLSRSGQGGHNMGMMAMCGHCMDMAGHDQHSAGNHDMHVTGTSAGVQDLALVSTTGDTVALADYVGREPLVLFLSGTDSLSGRAAGAVQKVYAKSDTAGPKLIAIVMAGTKAARGFAKRNSLTFPVLVDPDHQSMAAFGTDAMPLVLFLDRSGKANQTEAMITEETVREGTQALAAGEEKLVDPVCKMTVTKETAAGTYVYKGQTYYFCNKACKDNFTKDPQKYLAQ